MQLDFYTIFVLNPFTIASCFKGSCFFFNQLTITWALRDVRVVYVYFSSFHGWSLWELC